MRIAIGADHAGVALKEQVKQVLTARGVAFDDLGTLTTESVDYPDFAEAVSRKVASGEYDRGILKARGSAASTTTSTSSPSASAPATPTPRAASSRSSSTRRLPAAGISAASTKSTRSTRRRKTEDSRLKTKQHEYSSPLALVG